MNSVGFLASGIWEDLGAPQNPSITYISGWVGSSRGVGKLNTLLNTCFCVDDEGIHAGETFVSCGVTGEYQAGDFYPALNSAETAIYTEIYKGDYYEKRMRDSLNGISDSYVSGNMAWTELREGDSSIKRGSPTEAAKVYRGFLGDSKAELQKLVGYYRSNGANPRQVAGEDGG